MKKIKSVFRHIKVQITVYYFIASILLVAIFGGVLYFSTSATLLEETLSSTTTAVDHSGKYVEVYIDRLKALSTMIVEHPSTRGYLCSDDECRTDLVALVNSALSSDEYLQSITIIGKNGEVISNEEALDMITSNDMMQEDWYRQAIESEMPVLTSARMQDFSMDKESWVISISQEIIDETGENVGVLLIDIKYSVLESYFEDLDLGDEGMAFILNDRGEVVYHQDTAYFNDSDKAAELAKMAAMTGYEREMDILTHSYDLNNADWVLVGVSSLDGLKVIRRQVIETVILIGILLLLVAIGIGAFIAERITKPIKDLEKAMEEMTDMAEKVSIDYSTNYEVEELTLQFNRLIERIQALMKKISENEKNLRDFEIKALHSQINPHFLYNTLDTIVWMAEFDDSEKVIAVTKSLASFFRLSLSKGEEMIPLKDEVDHVKQYLFIQKQRYEEKLNYEISLDSSLDQVKVPKILLQPFAENALYHGIREKEGPGHIQIRVYKSDTQIYMEIEDDGVGFDPQTEKASNKTKLGGIGIKNVHDRIALYYGKEYGVNVESEIGKGTRVTIVIPAT